VGNLTLSEKYGMAAVVALMIMVAINSALLMLVLSVVGIIAGFWVLRRGEVRRVAFVAFGGFAIAAVFAVIGLVSAR
jgi:hypothetical protein